jgi:hypothetical protein
VDDKDASLFPVAIPNSSGKLELGMLHRPLFSSTRPEETACHPASREVDLDRESIWISYCPPVLKSREPDRLGRFTFHHRLATPVSPWERLKTAQELLRHANSRITQDIYMQAVSEEKRVAQDLVFRGLLRGGSTQHPSAPSETV